MPTRSRKGAKGAGGTPAPFACLRAVAYGTGPVYRKMNRPKSRSLAKTMRSPFWEIWRSGSHWPVASAHVEPTMSVRPAITLNSALRMAPPLTWRLTSPAVASQPDVTSAVCHIIVDRLRGLGLTECLSILDPVADRVKAFVAVR